MKYGGKDRNVANNLVSQDGASLKDVCRRSFYRYRNHRYLDVDGHFSMPNTSLLKFVFDWHSPQNRVASEDSQSILVNLIATSSGLY